MVKQEFKPLGVKVGLNVPASPEEFGPTLLSHGIKSVTAWTTLADWRYYFIHGITAEDLKEDEKNKLFITGAAPLGGVEEVTGIERKQVEVKDAKGVVKMKDNQPVMKFDESEEVYFKRVLAAKNMKADDFEELGQKIADLLVFNPEAKESTGRTAPVRLARKYKDRAGAMIANGNVEAFGAKYTELTGKPFSFTETKDLEKTFTATWTPSGTTETKTATVSDKDADALGWLAKEYAETYAARALDQVV